MSEQKTMYRAFFNFCSLSMWHTESPAPHFCSQMHLSQCGQYVEAERRRLDDQGWETIRQSLSPYWQPTQEQALAAVAPRLRAIGERLIRQADELEQNAQRPALDAVAASSGDVGSPADGGS